jgi:hypothetical protein
MGLLDYLNAFFDIQRPELQDIPDDILERLAAEQRASNMPLGIHGNYSCVRCGACCVCYAIEFPDGDFKKGGQVCKYLEYDFEKRIASCRVHDKGPNIRPAECIEYRYCAQGFYARTLDMWIGLKRTASRMPKIMERHYRRLERKRKKQEKDKEKSKKNSKTFIFW